MIWLSALGIMMLALLAYIITRLGNSRTSISTPKKRLPCADLPVGTKARRVAEDLPQASRVPIDHQRHLRRMLNMRLLQKAETYFRKPELPPVIQRQVTA